MPWPSSHTPIFRPKITRRMSGLRGTTPGGVPAPTGTACGMFGGTATLNLTGPDSLYGGTASTVGTDVINANVAC